MKKKILCGILAVAMLLVAVPTFADGVASKSFSATQLVNQFYTYSYITRPDNTTWNSQLILVISTLTSPGAESVKIRPVNKDKVAMGEEFVFTSVGNHYLYVDSNYKNIRLLVKNNNGGTNIVISGTWVGSYT